MISKLNPIIQQKELEVRVPSKFLQKKPSHEIMDFHTGGKKIKNKGFKEALGRTLLSIIAEIKRKSPSKGALAEIADPLELAKAYVKGGASAISVLTDEKFFSGSAEDLKNIASADFMHATPVLRKDFIIDTLQIAEAAFLGADAILCMVTVLGEKTKEIVTFAHQLGLDVLVEIIDESELEIALNSGSQIIGINNRNLNMFEIDTNQSFKLVDKIPGGFIKVAESGILDPELARQYHEVGFDAVLIGEALVKSGNPEKFIQRCRQ